MSLPVFQLHRTKDPLLLTLTLKMMASVRTENSSFTHLSQGVRRWKRAKDCIRKGRTACWRGPAVCAFIVVRINFDMVFDHLNNLWVAFSFCFIIYSAFYFNSIPAISLLRVVAMCPFSGELLGMECSRSLYSTTCRGLGSILLSPVPYLYDKFNFVNSNECLLFISSMHFLFVINLSEKPCLAPPIRVRGRPSLPTQVCRTPIL